MADLSQSNKPHYNTAEDHLSRLLADSVEEPWYKLLAGTIRDLIHPPKLPPLEITSKPVAVKDIWGLYGRQKKSFLMSTAFQACVVAVVLILGTNKTVQNAVKQNILFMPITDTALDQAKMQPKKDMGGGGGGDRSPLPASRGKLPPRALRQFTPAVAVYNNLNPKLAMDPTIIAPPDAKLPDCPGCLNYGDPLSKYTTPSNGTGSGGGI